MCKSQVCTCGYDECLNGGVFDPQSCRCNCPTNYYGRVCENFSTCSYLLTCENFASFNAQSCACSCISPNYSGSRCETLSCSQADPSTCSSYSSSQCTVGNFVYSLCPRMCGRCAVTTIATTAT